MLFIMPPSDEELLRRLRSRGRDDEAAIQRRYAEAQKETALARSSGAYDDFIVNDDLPRSLERICNLIAQRREELSAGPRG